MGQYDNEEIKSKINISNDEFDDLISKTEASAENKKNRIILRVRRALGFKFDEQISFKDEEVNQDHYNQRRKENPYFNVVSTIIGYEIKNSGEIPIVDIEVPKFKLNPEDGLYYGIEEKVTLKKDETLYLPRKYFAALLLRPEFNLKCDSGYLKAQVNKKALQKRDYDACLASMPFVFYPQWQEKCGEEHKGFVRPIGYAVYDKNSANPIRFELQEEFVERFGNYNNPIVKAKAGRPVEPKISNTSDAAKKLASIILMGKK